MWDLGLDWVERPIWRVPGLSQDLGCNFRLSAAVIGNLNAYRLPRPDAEFSENVESTGIKGAFVPKDLLASGNSQVF